MPGFRLLASVTLRLAQPASRALAAVLAFLPLLCASCYSVTRLQTPRTVAPGKVQFAAAMGITPITRNDSARLSPELALRLGVTDSTDVGLRVNPLNLELALNQQLVRNDVEVSVSPALLLAGEGDMDELFEESLPGGHSPRVRAFRGSVYVGSSEDRDFAAWIAPTLDLGVRDISDDSVERSELFVMPGLLCGFSVRTHESARFLFEVGLAKPVTGTDNDDPYGGGDPYYDTRLGSGDVRLQLAIGFKAGGMSGPDG